MSQKQVMPKSEDLSRSLEINAIWTFDTEFPTIFNKSSIKRTLLILHVVSFFTTITVSLYKSQDFSIFQILLVLTSTCYSSRSSGARGGGEDAQIDPLISPWIPVFLSL